MKKTADQKLKPIDSLTHIVLGACLGEVIAGRKMGKQAMLLGALSQLVPDLDFVTHFWMDTSTSIVAHRGLTHSILFCLFITALAPFASAVFYRGFMFRREIILVVAINLFAHIFLDAFNAYGTGWLEPFSYHRFSFHVLFVGDPLFSLGPLAAFLLLLFRSKTHQRRQRWAKLGIACSIFYLAYASVNKLIIETDLSRHIRRSGIASTGHFSTPTPLNSWLWYVVVKDSTGYYFGYRSVFDEGPRIDFAYFPRNDSLLKYAKDPGEAKKLVKFASGYYTIENWSDTLVFNVLRFGQVIGWHDPKERFAFHYFLNYGPNDLVVQRGRFAKWNRETIGSLLRRIRGKSGE